jgi:O-succinylhomoserine sulfhydrylase
MYLTSSFVFGSAAEAAARFSGAEAGPIYARFTNPGVNMFEERLAALEGAERCVAFASGMAAILATVMGLMKAGEHVVASRSIFGSTVQLFQNILGRFGIETTFVSPTDPAEWQSAAKPNTRLFFVESPSNPLTEVSDIRALADIAHRSSVPGWRWTTASARQCLAAPVAHWGPTSSFIPRPSIWMGRAGCWAGQCTGRTRPLMEGVYTFLRTAGPTLSAFNAWVLLKGSGDA